MSNGMLKKPLDLSELFMFGTRITSNGERFTMVNKWQEGNSFYCGVDSEVGGGSNFEMLSMIEHGRTKYLLLADTPDKSIDDPIISCMVLKTISAESLETISAEELDSISAKCLAIADLTREERHRPLRDFYGVFPEFEG